MIWYIPYDLKICKKIKVLPLEESVEYCCEYNVDNYISIFGGEKIKGVYILKHETLEIYQLINHYVVKYNEEYIDVTYFSDGRTFNMFIEIDIFNYNLLVQSLDIINIKNNQEVKLMYYVYCYIDPHTNEPFYVGKGKQNRAYTHMFSISNKNKNKTRFKNKVDKLVKNNTPPKIIFLAQNVEDEEIAYKIEEEFIKKYGRIGYDDGGILLNICENSRPPNHKGKTYKEIYGDRWKEEIEKRRKIQMERGGYGPKKHSQETKNKLKKLISKRKETGYFITEKEILKHGKEFCCFYNNKISYKKWLYWARKNNIPLNILRTYRFGGKYLLDVFCENFDSIKVKDSLLWYHNPSTNDKIRIFDWELCHRKIPDGYIRGRGKI